MKQLSESLQAPPERVSVPRQEFESFDLVWRWKARYPRTLDRPGQRCRIIVRGKMNSALIEFEDGCRAVVSRNGLRHAL